MMPQIVLASQSPSRTRLLRAAGVDFDQVVSGVDEDSVKQSLIAESARPDEIALTLAELKAVRATRDPQSLVIGADQVLVCQGQLFNKPDSLENGLDQLRRLRGQPHRLVSAVAVAKAGSVIWRHVDEAHMTMRLFSDQFLENYVRNNREVVLASVGSYWIESEGIQLFEKIEGDYFTILGLPLLPLLDFLRLHEAVAA